MPVPAYLSFLARVGSTPLNSRETDVKLLDDGRVQTVEVQQQNKLVIETWG